MAKIQIQYPDDQMKPEDVVGYLNYLVTEIEYHLTHIDNSNLSQGLSFNITETGGNDSAEK